MLTLPEECELMCVIFPKYLLCRLRPGRGSLQIPADGDTRQVRVQLQGAGHLPHALSKRGEIYFLVKNIKGVSVRDRVTA